MSEAKNESSGEATTSNDKLGVKQPVAWRVTHYQDGKPNVTLTDDWKRAEWIHGYYGRACSGVKQGKLEPLYLDT